MSRRNIDALRPIYEQWARGNFRPRFEVYSPEMVWGWSEEFPGLERVGADPQRRSERLRQWLSEWDDWRCEAEEYLAEGDWVVVLTRYSGRGKVSGALVDTTGAHAWQLRDGKVIRLTIYSNRQKALDEAGISGDGQP